MSEKTLHITNGDSVIPTLREAGIKGELLPWRDVLHEGRVLGGDDLAAVSRGRASAIADNGWGSPDAVADSFVRRDRILRSAYTFDKVVLWFEHDLYDQLQLLQLLNWFALHKHPQLFLIQHDDYLGMQNAAQLATLPAAERRVSSHQLSLAREAWGAFTADTPNQWANLLERPLEAFPHLNASIVRLLEFLPNPTDRLDRNRRQTLQLISQGITAPDVLFEAWQGAEQARFMGDSSYWLLLEHMLEGKQALLQSIGPSHFSRPTDGRYDKDFLASRLKLTELGLAALNGELTDSLTPTQAWLGGWHLLGETRWHWNPVSRELT